eukprot:m.58669 g.58669  ORF g.58669 m.58669 type:complete len:133 (-) comp12892_c0_seq1:506-904(-)
MLRRDDQLRLSEAVQGRYRQRPDDGDWKLRVTTSVQHQVAREHGFSDTAQGVELLRSAVALFGHDQEVMSSAHYLRHNIVRSCPLVAGQMTPDVPLGRVLWDSDEAPAVPTSLHALVATSPMPTVILAGSHT